MKPEDWSGASAAEGAGKGAERARAWAESRQEHSGQAGSGHPHAGMRKQNRLGEKEDFGVPGRSVQG